MRGSLLLPSFGIPLTGNQSTSSMTNINYFEQGISNQLDAALEYAEVELTEAQTQKMFEIVLEKATDSISDIIGDLINEM